MPAATYSADQVAEIAGVSTFALYQDVRRAEAMAEADGNEEECPPPGPIGTLAIRIGKRVVWPRTAIDRLFCVVPAAPDKGAGT